MALWQGALHACTRLGFQACTPNAGFRCQHALHAAAEPEQPYAAACQAAQTHLLDCLDTGVQVLLLHADDTSVEAVGHCTTSGSCIPQDAFKKHTHIRLIVNTPQGDSNAVDSLYEGQLHQMLNALQRRPQVWFLLTTEVSSLPHTECFSNGNAACCTWWVPGNTGTCTTWCS